MTAESAIRRDKLRQQSFSFALAALGALVVPADAASDPFSTVAAPVIISTSQVMYGDGETAVTSPDTAGTAAAPQKKTVASGTVTLRPGIFWGGISITGGNVTLLPGRYVMAGGGFNISASATVMASNVFIYNTRDPYSNAGAAQYAAVTLAMDLSTLKACNAQIDAYYSDLFVFNDRNAGTTVSLSNTPASFQGSIYDSSGQVSISAGNVTTNLRVVAYDIAFSRNSTNAGSLQAFHAITVPTGKSLAINDGSLETDGAGGLPFLPLGAVTLNSGTVTVNQLCLTNNGSSSLTFNAGLLQSGGSSVSNSVTFTVGDGVQSATLDLLGGTHTFADGLMLSTNSSLIGSGDIVGSVTNFSIIAPGHSVGVISITGDLALMESSLLDFEITGSGTNDHLDISGLLAAGGGLKLTFANGYTGNAGDTFDLLNFGSLTGAFSQTNLPALGAGMEWNTDHLYTQGAIAIVPEPGACVLLALGMGMLTRRRRR